MSNTTQFVANRRPAQSRKTGSTPSFSSASAAGDKFKRFSVNGRFLTQPVTGVQRYAREVTMSLDGLLAADNTTAFLCAPETFGDGDNYKAMQLAAPSRMQGVLWEQFHLPRQRQGPLLNLCNMAPLAVRNQVVCIHDVNTFLRPESYSASFRLFYRVMLPLVARRAARVVTVSAFSASMISRHLGIKNTEIEILPNGHEHAARWQSSASSIFSVHLPRRPYVLMISSRAKHKNLGLIVSMAEALDNLGLDLWIAGGAPKIFSGVASSNASNIKWLGSVSDDDLAALFSKAFCLAFPSLTEGFGLPLVEAMALHCPIVSSDRASMPEVCGDAALLADPEDSRAWIAHFSDLAGSRSLRSELVEKGRLQVARFSWDRTAAQYRDLMQELAA
jgi:glycosyltransferase involved in cell wall biosynthesis